MVALGTDGMYPLQGGGVVGIGCRRLTPFTEAPVLLILPPVRLGSEEHYVVTVVDGGGRARRLGNFEAANFTLEGVSASGAETATCHDRTV